MLQEGRSKLTEGAAKMLVLADEGAGAPQVGADLRAARERIGYTLEEIAVELRIRLAYLEALEAGRISDLPGSAYALGFLRIYAEALGLDAEEISRSFKSEADAMNKQTELDFPSPTLRAGIPAGAMVLLGLVLVVVVYIGWYKLSGDGRLPAEVVATVPARLAPFAQQAGVLAAAPALTTDTPSRPADPPAVAVSAQEAPPVISSRAAAAMPLPPPAPIADSSAAAPLAPEAGAPAAEGRIVVRVKADVWIQMHERNGPVIFNRVLKPGETYAVPARAGLLFTTGNALATEFLVDGTASPGLGGVKGVRRDLILDADAIRDGRLAAQLAGSQNDIRAQ